jgi:septal ring factor EnvC (AmiA/AmiB activator)
MRLALAIPASLAALVLGAAALAQVPATLSRLNLEETQLSAEQARNMNQLARLLSVLVELRHEPPPAFLVAPQDARDAVRAAILVKALTPELQARAQAFASTAGDMARQRRLAAVESEALFTRQSQAADQAPLSFPQAPQLRGPAEAQAPIEPPAIAPARLLQPVQGKVIRRFGQLLPSGGRSDGLSYAAQRGASVQSPGDGIVQYAGPVKGWGVILILRLTGGYHLVLAGLDRSSFAVGQSVAAGQTVGWMPDTRQSSNELYLEVRQQGSPVDPAKWLKNNAG